jgi:hypothetical protein
MPNAFEPIQPMISQTNPLPITAPSAFISSPNQTQTAPIQLMAPADKHLNTLPNINSPIILSQPITEINNNQSFTHQLLTFTSQVNDRDPPNPHHKTTRLTRVNHKNTLPRTHNPYPVNDPPRNQLKKSKISIPKITKNPTQPHLDHAAVTENNAGTELQTEKKQRREEDNSTNNESSHDHVHFLTAGPSSQDCRDQ